MIEALTIWILRLVVVLLGLMLITSAVAVWAWRIDRKEREAEFKADEEVRAKYNPRRTNGRIV